MGPHRATPIHIRKIKNFIFGCWICISPLPLKQKNKVCSKFKILFFYIDCAYLAITSRMWYNRRFESYLLNVIRTVKMITTLHKPSCLIENVVLSTKKSYFRYFFSFWWFVCDLAIIIHICYSIHCGILITSLFWLNNEFWKIFLSKLAYFLTAIV